MQTTTTQTKNPPQFLPPVPTTQNSEHVGNYIERVTLAYEYLKVLHRSLVNNLGPTRQQERLHILNQITTWETRLSEAKATLIHKLLEMSS